MEMMNENLNLFFFFFVAYGRSENSSSRSHEQKKQPDSERTRCVRIFRYEPRLILLYLAHPIP